ncbi:hypothetical protein [Marinobacter sp. LV10MA510-1]|uniref:hypothetical protein n=1 Tax=Marinobacter sp. LV10MA510-1 TaxID=1415567 RepID=UPI000BF913B1|nr:hypothetical protein [Marinobacter sp. LV10MA510-1]PFG10683.1 hypothetical protein ATI45_3151 [Marinobacter sp. LV10MA510-1]
MDEEKVRHLLSAIPGAKRAAEGVIIPGEGGQLFHLRNIITCKETEGLSRDEAFFIEFCSRNEILRLREISGPHDYLLRLRANAIVNNPRAVRVMASRKKDFEKGGRPWALTHFYHSKDFFHKKYIKNLSRSNAKIVKGTPSGLAFIPEANALCMRSLVGDVVVVSESLEQFYYFMNIAFYGNQLGIEMIDSVDALLIAVRIMNGVEALDFDIDPRASLPIETERELNNLVSNQMQFTYGHEYAHLLCGHISSPETAFDHDSSSSNYLGDLQTYNHSLEFQADLCALTNIYRSQEAFQNIAQGAFSVLLYLHFLEEANVSFGIKKFSVSETHPTSLDRVYNLHEGLGKKSPIDNVIIDEMLKHSDQMISILKHRIKCQREDILSFYGSIYLPSYHSKPKRDRYDF